MPQAARTPILRTSERRAFKRCVWRWYHSYRMGLVPIGSTHDALWFGTGVHLALAEWYKGPGTKRGAHPAETFKKWAANELRFIRTQDRMKGQLGAAVIEEKLVPAKELGVVMLDEYVKMYGQDPNWSVIAPEHSGQVDVLDPRDASKVLLIYAFTYDLVYRDLEDDYVKLGEHKTAKAIQTDHLPLDDQAGSYWAIASQELAASGLIGPKERIRGIEYNFLRKALPDPRPRNSDGHYTNKPTKQNYIEAFTDWEFNGSTDSGVSIGVKMDVTNLEKLKLEQLADLAAEYDIQVLGEVSKVQPQPYFVREFIIRTARERTTQIRRIQDEGLHMEAVRTKALPLIKNPTRDCQWDCDFYQLCKMDEGNHADTREYRQTMFNVQDPYATHRKSTEE
jgi:hypothetical protein